MKSAASDSIVSKLKLDSKLLLGTLLCCLVNKPVFALADDAQELAAIKAQMRLLAAQVNAIEQRQAKRKGSKTQTAAASTNRSTPARTLVTSAPADPAIRFSPDPADTTRVASGGLPLHSHGNTSNPLGFEWLPTQDVVAHGHSAMDLSSSSPSSITQTSVDHLPPIFSIGGISVKLGGFIELSNIWRDSNMTAGPATAWGSFPYANSPNHGLSEERLSAQLSRVSILMEANPTNAIRLQAYIESDFGGAAGTSNSVQISGYTPRMRQGYFTFTQKDWGFHLLMGQAWSLVTNYSKGLLPRKEQLPAVTDNNQIPGIAFTRVPQIRIGKDWHEKYWLGLSLEDPEATFNFSSSVPSGGTLPAAYGQTAGTRVYYQNAGGVLLNSGTNYTYNPAPDIVVKAAADTSFGHYEVFGLGRWFRSLSVLPGATTSKKHTSFGGGVGAGMTTPLGTKKLQLAGNILAGEGVGRYGPSLLPDTTFNAHGQLTPVPEIIGSLGLIGHPSHSVLLYTYGGVETSGRKSYLGADGHNYGYGVTDQNLSGCSIEFGACNAQTRTLASLTTGGWWHFMDGHYGSLMAGLQYTYIRKFAFKGTNGAGSNVYPTTFGNTVYVTFRYLPFQ
ncbi:hypothetical protein ACI01nite_16500 [Acetobacter cibinongensis]|uniref:Porin n=1 Tax=Acetobacter cibinongensis TaxID=146475 RepID=A0A0D6N052_9PROT|nr:hypothetical protein Abci_003_062 [Acetobacter cibinongensis]GBQ13761.1 hypothetical protein AA0482_0705 [Acetobacter cibinongensis NRIC 0482]GEL59048.1 hypothetical protein ACI01nite_16500 [Acetobacter cibinongensis]